MSCSSDESRKRTSMSRAGRPYPSFRGTARPFLTASVTSALRALKEWARVKSTQVFSDSVEAIRVISLRSDHVRSPARNLSLERGSSGSALATRRVSKVREREIRKRTSANWATEEKPSFRWSRESKSTRRVQAKRYRAPLPRRFSLRRILSSFFAERVGGLTTGLSPRVFFSMGNRGVVSMSISLVYAP